MLRKKFAPAWQKGFTLIELLVVIGILGILIAVVLVAVNPSRQFATARDTQRRADLYAVTNGLYQFATEHNGNFPEDAGGNPIITTNPTDIGTDGLNLVTYLVPTYLPAIPEDPGPTSTTAVTGYWIHLDANGRLVATASSEVNINSEIKVSR